MRWHSVGGPGNRDDAIFKQIGDEIAVRLDALALRSLLANYSRTGRKCVESAFRHVAGNARNIAEPFDDQIALRFELRRIIGDRYLRTFERFRRGRLADRGRIARALRLKFRHLTDKGSRFTGVPKPPAGHGVSL